MDGVQAGGASRSSRHVDVAETPRSSSYTGARQMPAVPRLPPELIELVVAELTLPSTYGDPRASAALAALACTSRTVREWALDARYNVAVAPRHVRDFRKWLSRVQRDMPGHNRALFVALDDVSKLTSMSAGWDVELLRLLQRLGPHLTHLSLWTSETRSLLRDPAQVRSPRVRNNLAPVASVQDVMEHNKQRRRGVARTLRRLERGTLIQGDELSRVPLKTRFTRDEQQTRAEIAAARERARQKMPNWLRHELTAASGGKDDVKRRYKAHLSAVAREYQHEREAADEERRQIVSTHGEWESLLSLGGADTPDAALAAQVEESSDEEEGEDDGIDLAANWACMPLRLSICPTLPLHEHEEPLNFARMTVFTRVEELDIFVSVPAEVPRILELFASLVASPLRKVRFSSVYASLLIVAAPARSPICTTGGEQRLPRQHDRLAPCANIAGGLARVLRSTTLRSLLFDEFHDRRAPDARLLENAIASVIAGCDNDAVLHDAQPASTEAQSQAGGQQQQLHSPQKRTARARRGEGLAGGLWHSGLAGMVSPGHGPDSDDGDDTYSDAQPSVQVRILQGKQGHYGKLKDRRQDFLCRALNLGSDCWREHGLE